MSRVLDQLQRWAEIRPDAVALQDGRRTLSFAQLWQSVVQLRTQIRAGGHSVIALAGDNTFAWITADLALLGLPVRAIPIPSFFSSQQIQHIFRLAQVDLVLATQVDMQRVPGINPVQLCLLDAELDLVSCHLPVLTHYAGDYEKVTFTSGSTGAPKGVRLALDTLEHTALAIAETLADIGIESHLGVLPYATLLENCAGIYAPLLQGVSIHVRQLAELGLASPDQFNPMQFVGVLQQLQPHATILVPQLMLALVTLMQRGLMSQHAFRFIAVGGGKVSPQVLIQAEALNLPVYEGYGLSECGSVVTLNTPSQRKIGSVGKVLPHVRLAINAQGEIQVRGSVMRGYLGEADRHGETILTGDLGNVDEDGFVYVSGRCKHLFITAFGRNVNPEWIESELLGELAIAQVAVFGEAQSFNTAIVVLRQGFDQQALDAAVAQVNSRLPDYARIGQVILATQPFTAANGLATANGRLRRDAIAQDYCEQLNQETPNGIFSTAATAN